MIYTIENDCIRVEISDLGAELQLSLIHISPKPRP